MIEREDIAERELDLFSPLPVIDAHCHFFPQRMFEAIWNVFESVGWGVHRGEVDELPETLIGHGVERYTVLNYVRKPGQAEELNAWTAEFCQAHPEAIPFGAVHVEDPNPWSVVAPYLEEHDFRGVKIQPLVSEFGIDDKRLRPLLKKLEAGGKILFAHAGTAPYANDWVGLDRLERVMEELPKLKVIVAHMGAYEVERALTMVDRYPNLYLDTAMTFVDTDLFEANPRIPAGELEKRADKILFGSDFPSFPYPYAHALESILKLGLSVRARKKIFFENALMLLGEGD